MALNEMSRPVTARRAGEYCTKFTGSNPVIGFFLQKVPQAAHGCEG